MTTAISSFQDILDALEQNPEYRQAMRRLILDEEFLQLPAIVRELQETVADLARTFREYTAATNARLDRLEAGQAALQSDVTDLKAGQAKLEAGQARLEQDVNALKAGQTRLEQDVADLKTGQAKLEAGQAKLEAGQAKLEAGQAKLEAGQTRLEGRVGDVSGTAYERRIVKHCRRIVNRHLGLKRPAILHSINMNQNADLDDMLDAANAAGAITDAQIYDLDAADIIVVGTGADGQTAYVAIEVSETIGDDDVDRARERADIVGRAAGSPAMAAVIGKAISDANRQRAAQSSVTAIIMMAD